MIVNSIICYEYVKLDLNFGIEVCIKVKYLRL